MKKRIARIVPSPRNRPTAQPTVLAYEEVQRSDSPIRKERAGSIIRSGDSAAALLKLVQNRPGLDTQAVVTPDSGHCQPLIEYLCVCGSPGVPDGAPVVLAHTPDTATAETQLPLFCFLDGPPPSVPGCDLSVYPLDDVRRADSTFMTNLGAAAVYVYVVRSWEILEEPAPWIHVRTMGALAAQRHLTLRAYCIVSRHPYGRLFWDILFHVARLERDRLTTVDAERRVRCVERQKALFRIVDRLATERAAPGRNLRLESKACFGPVGVIEFPMPDAAQSPRVGVAAMCLPALMRAFSPTSLVSLLCATLTESKVIFYGKSPGRVSACVLALAAAIAPFAWQGTLMPLVPRRAAEVVEAPVPVLCGRIVDTLEPITDDDMRTVVASVDGGTVITIGPPLPDLPCVDVLRVSLSEAHMLLRASLRSRQDDTPFAPLNDRDALCIYSSVEALNQYTVWLLDSIRRHLPDGAYNADALPDNPAVCADLLKKLRPESIEFVDGLFNTQHYHAIAMTFGEMPAPESRSIGAYDGCVL